MIDRQNEIDLSDPLTFEPLFELSIGDFNAKDREGYSVMQAEGFTRTGQVRLASFQGVSADAPCDSVVADPCIDVSEVLIVDAQGASRIAPDRPDISGVEVIFVRHKSQLLIDSAQRLAVDEGVIP